MANVNSTNYALEIARPRTIAPPGKIGGKLRVVQDSYVYTAVNTINDVILSSKIPEGATILDAYIEVTNGGGTGKATMGYIANDDDVADPNAFITEVDFSGAAASARPDKDEAGLFKLTTVETRLSVTVTQAQTTATGTMNWYVIYFVE